MKKILFVIICLCVACGFSSPKTSGESDVYEVKEVVDLAYYSGEDVDPDKHKLDLYLPKGLKQFPVMLWIHGGAWVVGSRKQEKELAHRFAEQGIGMAVISYRLSPGTWMDPKLTTGIQHPEHIRDCVRAFKWVVEHSAEYGGDVENLFVSGYSAGGHLSALMAIDSTYMTEAGLRMETIKAAVPMAGAYDMVAYYNSHLASNGKEMADGHVLGVFGDLKTAKIASPTAYINQARIPMLVISETQTYDYTLLFEEAAKPVTGIEFYHDRQRTHQSLYLAMRDDEECDTRDKIVAYIREKAGQGD